MRKVRLSLIRTYLPSKVTGKEKRLCLIHVFHHPRHLPALYPFHILISEKVLIPRKGAKKSKQKVRKLCSKVVTTKNLPVMKKVRQAPVVHGRCSVSENAGVWASTLKFGDEFEMP